MLQNSKSVPADLPSDDEVEKFHKSRDKLSLNPADDSASEDDEDEDDLEEAIYNLSDDVGAESDDDEESDEDDDGRLAERERRKAVPDTAHCPGVSLLSNACMLSNSAAVTACVQCQHCCLDLSLAGCSEAPGEGAAGKAAAAAGRGR